VKPPLTECTIRVGTPDVCERVLELWAASNAQPTVTDTTESLLCLLRTDEQALLLADIRGEVVGSLIAAWNGWRGSLYRLAVHPRHRRCGLATRLVRDGEKRLRDRGAMRIDAIVADDDVDAAGFWTAAGYRHHGHRSRFVRNL
jgi:ribosomal protein S18 acetylase RimI-like enzyme